MRLTKFEHACLLVEDGGARLLIDPGTYSRGFESLTDLSAILITHQHADHVDLARLGPLLERNPDAQLCCDQGTAPLLREAGLTVTTVDAGAALAVGTEVVAYGTDHEMVHPDLPQVRNVGYLIGGRLFHPGDAFTVPEIPVEILALPTGGPWLKLGESIDYLRAVAPRVAVPIHEATLARPDGHIRHFTALAPERTTVVPMQPGSVQDLA